MLVLPIVWQELADKHSIGVRLNDNTLPGNGTPIEGIEPTQAKPKDRYSPED